MSSAAAAHAARRVRRQKQFIAVGSVALLAILGFQLPKLLGGRNDAAPEATTAAAPAPTSISPQTPLQTLPDTDRVTVERDTNQLVSLGLFKSKDPFVQQLTPVAAPAPTPVAAPPVTPAPTTPAAPPTPTTPTTTVTTPAPTDPTATTPSPTPVIPPSSSPAAPAPAPAPAPTSPSSSPASVLLSTNGVCEQVSVNGTFPANDDVFRLVEIAKDGRSVKIAIVGGSYDSGEATATAELGKKLTLVNTSDGTRYVIVLQAKCAVIAKPAPPSATTTTTTAVVTPSAPALTPQSSSPPIVPDSADTQAPPSS